MWSVKRNHLQCAQILLDFKASVDLQDTDGDSALHMACGLSHGTILRLLLDRGASLTLRNKRKYASLEIAAKAGSSDAAMAIAKHKRLVAILKIIYIYSMKHVMENIFSIPTMVFRDPTSRLRKPAEIVSD